MTLSVRSAALRTGCHPKRLRKLLRALGRLDDTAAGTDAQTTFEATEDLLDRLASSMSLAEAREHLGVPRPHDRLLLEAGHLVPWIRGGTADLKDHAFARKDLDAFLFRLLDGAVQADEGDGDLLGIPEAARRANCSAMEIVDLALDGRLARRRIDPSAKGYLSLLVDADEIAPHVRLPDPGGITLRQVERRTGIRSHVLKALALAGHIPVRRVVNPVNRCPQDVVDERDLKAFEERYATLGRLSDETGVHPRTLKHRIEAAGITTAFPSVDGSPYPRQEVLALPPPVSET